MLPDAIPSQAPMPTRRRSSLRGFLATQRFGRLSSRGRSSSAGSSPGAINTSRTSTASDMDGDEPPPQQPPSTFASVDRTLAIALATAPPLATQQTVREPTATHETQMREVILDLTAPSSDEVQDRAVARLAALIDDATAIQAQQLGECIRDYGALEALLNLLERPNTEQDALRVIGNLASNAVDPNAADTKRLLFELGAFDKILRRIHSESGPTVVYALGSVQNMCARREFALHMQETGADARLRQLVETSTNASARAFANGCLSNMDAVLSPTFVPDPRLEPRSTSSSTISAPSSPRTPASPRTPESPRTQHAPSPTSTTTTLPLRLTSPPRRRTSPDAPPEVVARMPRPLGKDGVPLCAVCLDKPVNTALTPCFHAGFCNSCAVTISYNRFPCPFCRGGVTGLQRIYL